MPWRQAARLPPRLSLRKLPPGGNNGLALRTPVTQDQLAYAATDIQILDDDDPQYVDLQDYQVHGRPRLPVDICGPTANGISRRSRSTATS